MRTILKETDAKRFLQLKENYLNHLEEGKTEFLRYFSQYSTLGSSFSVTIFRMVKGLL